MSDKPRRPRRAPGPAAPEPPEPAPRDPDAPVRLLFVCSRNLWRSPTAERLWRRPGFEVRSAGTRDGARRRVTASDLAWADLVLAMETRHRAQLRSAFPGARAEIVVLDVPDAWEADDPELVEILEERVGAVLEARGLDR